MILFGRTDTGRIRKNNEDSFYASARPVGMFEKLMIVCDGMGGHSYGEVASRTCVEALVEYIRMSPVNNPDFVMEQAIYKANLRVKKKAEQLNARECGTTMVMAGIVNSHAYIANIGDSRAYLVDPKAFTITQITRDHSLVEEQVRRGLIKRHSPEYEKHKNVITRAVGIFDEADPEYFEVILESGQYLLLCSDGLSNMIPDLVIKNLVLDETLPLDARVNSLIRLANENGGRDNITAVLLCEED
ncbi:MAG: Stp1/IreP family PP2C-type Ser/Thr phosphatase [Lachnospiraceae bacterium]|nr:Stp1/IreP family PP2C-type Ser/Thr phosphatase [Lachnospiraceae bacterium]